MAFKTYSITKKYIDPRKTPFYVEDLSGENSTLKIHKNANNSPTITVYYSFDTETWVLMGNTTVNGITLGLTPYQRVYLRASTNTWGGDGFPNIMETNKDFKIGGNILSLLYGENFNGQSVFPEESSKTFEGLFQMIRTLKSSSEVILPVTTVNSSYGYMFYQCSNMIDAPIIRSTILSENSCQHMFDSCSSLNSVICLATDISASDSTASWLSGVSPTGTFTTPSSTQWPTGVNGIPEGWTRVNA